MISPPFFQPGCRRPPAPPSGRGRKQPDEAHEPPRSKGGKVPLYLVMKRGFGQQPAFYETADEQGALDAMARDAG